MSTPPVCPSCHAKLDPEMNQPNCPACGFALPSQPPTAGIADQPTLAPSSKTTAGMALSADRDFGDYELINEIARGGMGVVYRARQRSLDRNVALKMILEGELASAAEIDRFQIEAQAAAHLDHPGIVPVYDHGVIEGRHYFAMAFVEGESLNDRIAAAPLNDRQAAELLYKIADAIDYAHQRGIIHRDLKPANILLDGQGNPRITDFGLAKRRDNQSQLTIAGQLLGTPSYMSPEQASGRGDVGHSADIYALGGILYAMLTGQPPFEGATIVETVSQVIDQDPVRPQQRIDRKINLDLETICLKCLEKDPLDRYRSAANLREELQRFLDGEPIEARPLSKLEKLRRWRKVIARNNHVRLRSSSTLLGWPVVDIAFGCNADRTEETGHARGIFAYGDRATGLVAVGGLACGGIAFGSRAIGIVSCGMFSAGLFSAGLISIGIFTGGGLAVGYFATGLVAVGYRSFGMFAFGLKTAWGAFRWS